MERSTASRHCWLLVVAAGGGRRRDRCWLQIQGAVGLPPATCGAFEVLASASASVLALP